MRFISIVVAAVFVGGAWPAVSSAQSLGEIARKEEERRKAIQTPGKVYTAADLKRFGGVVPTLDPAPPPTGAGVDPSQAERGAPAAGAGGADPAQAAGQPAQAAGQGAPVTDTGQAPEPERDQAWWRQKFAETRSRLDVARATVRALRAQHEILSMAMTEDPAERVRLDRERDRVKAEGDRLQGEVDTLASALAALEAEARRANVPPGWIR